MKKWKKSLLGLTLSAAVLVSLSACGSGSASSEDKGGDSKGFTLLSPDHSADHPKNKDLWMWKEYEKKQVFPLHGKKQKILTKRKIYFYQNQNYLMLFIKFIGHQMN